MSNLVWIAIFIIIFLFLQKVSGKPMNLSTEGRIARTLSAPEALQFIRERSQEEDVVILDVRTGPEHQSGAIPGSIHLNLFDSGFAGKLKNLDLKKTYLIYCASGNRSKSALRVMHDLGFEEVYEYDGGYSHYARNI